MSAPGSKIAEARTRASGLPIPVSTRPVPPTGHQGDESPAEFSPVTSTHAVNSSWGRASLQQKVAGLAYPSRLIVRGHWLDSDQDVGHPDPADMYALVIVGSSGAVRSDGDAPKPSRAGYAALRLF